MTQTNYQIDIEGVVQGVGFRPHVYHIATQLNISGVVYNDGEGVKVKLNASFEKVQKFIQHLTAQLPPLARVDNIQVNSCPDFGHDNQFKIITSKNNVINTQISADATTCPECVSELFDPTNRRYHYPFINCTHCGPRYSIIKRLPYDRPYTSMAEFALCETCQAEYNDPNDRRFHAQPNACDKCGPQLRLLDKSLCEYSGRHLIARTQQLLRDGDIVAIKGLGGYHLVCDALNKKAVNKLRNIKKRANKPLSIMVKSLSVAQKICKISKRAEQHLTSQAAPIVLMPSQDNTLDYLAPGMNSLGVMLPYTPLHHLLFAEHEHGAKISALVMTSANLPGQPLIYQDDLPKLTALADHVLTHNRDIVKRCDDSIVNCLESAHNNGEPNAIIVRRGRGMAPTVIKLANGGPATLAVGAFLKNSVCLTNGNNAYLSQYIGDLDNPDNCRYLQETIEHMMQVFDIKPEQVVTDKHPDFYSSQFASQFTQQHNLPLLQVQHHHAHAAAVACEHDLTDDYLALSLDGVGLGEDGTSWGGELLYINNNASQRLGSLQTIVLPGGDIAAKQPWRIATGFLIENGQLELAQSLFGNEQGFDIVKQMVERNVNCPRTSSLGRLFDLAGALLKVSYYNEYEAHTAMLLEAANNQADVTEFKQTLYSISELGQLSFNELLLTLPTLSAKQGASLFHQQLSMGLAEWLIALAPSSELPVVFSGGCLLNQTLVAGLRHQLSQTNHNLLFAVQAPPNDSGIALGQAWIGINQRSEVCA